LPGFWAGAFLFVPQKQQSGFSMFRLCDAARVAGIEARQLSNWLDRRLIDIPALGSGSYRNFSRDDVVRVALTAELTRLGVQVSEAAKAAATFCDDAGAYRDASELFADGKTILLVDSDGARCINVPNRETFDAAMLSVYEAERSAVAVVVVDAIVRQVEAALASGTPRHHPAGAVYKHGREVHVA
jgi:DNA-binding transcriptional MerR regulator